MPKFFTTPNPSNASMDPQKNVFFFDEDCPNKFKNLNNQVIWVGDEVYFDGGNGKLTKLIQIGVGPDDFNLAEITTKSGKKVRINAKACYPTRVDSLLQYKGLGTPILIGILMLIVIYFLCCLPDLFSGYNIVFTW